MAPHSKRHRPARRRAILAALTGPPALAFLPAIILGAYWFGGEGILLFFAFFVPGLLAALGAFGRRRVTYAGTEDPTTGLPGRDGLIAHVDELLAEGPTRVRLTACLVLGIDEVERLLDRHGRRACETLMAIVAARARATLRTGDMIARADDFELALVVTGLGSADLENLLRIAARLQGAVSDPVTLETERIYLTASVGLCLPGDASDASGAALLEAAEVALGEARASGTSAVRAFNAEMKARAATRSDLASELRDAMENGDFVPWFQPQIEAVSGKISGAEALARWLHPERGMIAPGLFLPLVEEVGATELLGRVILDAAIESLSIWDKAGLEVPTVSINFSLDELRNPGLVETVETTLSRYRMDPVRLNVEVLETVIASTRNDTVVRNLWALSELGCRIELDDFGTGHAAIGNIRRFAVGCIKIDRSFVSQIDTDLEQQNVISAILTMADRLSLETIAEGVETAEERAILARLGCAQVQGFGIARPMPSEQFIDWARRYRPVNLAASRRKAAS